MTRDRQISAGQGNGRQRRLSLVAALVFGLLASLFHCTSEFSAVDLGIAGPDATVVAMDFDGAIPPDSPDHTLPAHCGHCLSHVTAQPAFCRATSGGRRSSGTTCRSSTNTGFPRRSSALQTTPRVNPGPQGLFAVSVASRLRDFICNRCCGCCNALN
jgi:hypothetical protein